MGRLTAVRKGAATEAYKVGRSAAKVEGATTKAGLKAMEEAGFKVPKRHLLAAYAGRNRDPLLIGGAGGVALSGVRIGGGGDVRKSATHVRSGSFAGKTRGVGRKQTDGLTSGATVIRTPSLREINGKFAGQGQGVKVFHPASGTRGNVHTKGLVHIGKVANPFKALRGKSKTTTTFLPNGHAHSSGGPAKGGAIKHSDTYGSYGERPPPAAKYGMTFVRKGMLGPVNLAAMAPHTGARRGVRLLEP